MRILGENLTVTNNTCVESLIDYFQTVQLFHLMLCELDDIKSGATRVHVIHVHAIT